MKKYNNLRKNSRLVLEEIGSFDQTLLQRGVRKTVLK
jgi:hypothetical protein